MQTKHNPKGVSIRGGGILLPIIRFFWVTKNATNWKVIKEIKTLALVTNNE